MYNHKTRRFFSYCISEKYKQIPLMEGKIFERSQYPDLSSHVFMGYLGSKTKFNASFFVVL